MKKPVSDDDAVKQMEFEEAVRDLADGSGLTSRNIANIFANLSAEYEMIANDE